MFRSKRPKKVKKVKKIKRISISFLSSILAMFIFIPLITILNIEMFSKIGIDFKTIGICFWGGIFGYFLARSGKSKAGRARVFIHELKHAISVWLAGGVVDEFKVNKQTGHVRYQLNKNAVRYDPYIILAPYCFPFASFLVLIGCFFIPHEYILWSKLVLAITLSFDIWVNIDEIHPGQTDFEKIMGGIFISSIFICLIMLLWINVCLTWLIAGEDGYYYLFKLLLSKVGLERVLM